MRNVISSFLRLFGWGRKPKFEGWHPPETGNNEISKAYRLAMIAMERNALKDKLAIARKQKKARRHLYEALEALKIEEMELAGDVR